MIIPPHWSLPDSIRSRLGQNTYGRQRAIVEDGQVLLVLHLPPGPDDEQRQGILFWRTASGEWLASKGSGSVAALKRHVQETGSVVGAPGMGAMVPVQGMPRMPKGAKIGLIIGGIGAVVGIGVAVVVVAMQFVGTGTSDATEGSGVCAQAARCCETIGGPATACANYGRVGVPDSACQTALEGYKSAAQAQGKTCQ